MATPPIERVRAVCLALPEAHEVTAWGAPTFRVRNKIFAMYSAPDTHHGHGRPGLWVKAAPGNQDLMVRTDATRFFVPPYVGPSGWIGVWLDRRPRWSLVTELVEDAYRLTAPKRVLARLAAGGRDR